MTQPVISEFAGPYRFLSSFWPHPITYKGILYPTNEHPFQVAKTADRALQIWIASAATAGEAKRRGRTVSLVPRWNEQKRYTVMEELIDLKFGGLSIIGPLLCATGDAVLIEGNRWHDNTWGVCYCGRCTNGHNLLGWMLMRRRAVLLRMGA